VRLGKGITPKHRFYSGSSLTKLLHLVPSRPASVLVYISFPDELDANLQDAHIRTCSPPFSPPISFGLKITTVPAYYLHLLYFALAPPSQVGSQHPTKVNSHRVFGNGCFLPLIIRNLTSICPRCFAANDFVTLIP